MRFGALLWLALGTSVLVGLGYWASRQPVQTLVLPAVDPSRPLPQGGVFVGAITDPAHLNPLTTRDGVVRSFVLRYTHDSLLDRDPLTGELRDAAARVEEIDGGMALRVRLRDGLVFEDGQRVTSDDLLFTLALAKSPGMPLGGVEDCFSRIERGERVDDVSLVLRLVRRDRTHRLVVGTDFPVLQRAAWQAAMAGAAKAMGLALPAPGAPDAARVAAAVVLPGPGTGAYALAREVATSAIAWRRGQDLVLLQNPRSWRRTAYPRAYNLLGVRYRVLPEAAARVAELRAGRLDWYFDEDGPALHADPEISARYQLLKYATTRSGHHMVVWNTRRPHLADVRVRRALAMLFDRQTILDKHMSGNGVVAAAWFRPTDPEYPPDLAAPPFDIEAARQLLVQAGIGHQARLTLTILVPDFTPLHRRILEEALPTFASVGIDLDVQRRSMGEVQQRLDRREFDGALFTWYHSPWIDPFTEFHSSQADPPGLNFSGLCDREIDATLAAAREVDDVAARVELYRKFCHLLNAAAPVALLVHPRSTLLVSRRFDGVAAGALGVVLDGMWLKP